MDKLNLVDTIEKVEGCALIYIDGIVDDVWEVVG